MISMSRSIARRSRVVARNSSNVLPAVNSSISRIASRMSSRRSQRPRVGMPIPPGSKARRPSTGKTSSASARTLWVRCCFRPRRIVTSTRRSRTSRKYSSSPAHSKSENGVCQSISTSTSTSLSGRASPRTVEPNRARRVTPWARSSASCASRMRIASSRDSASPWIACCCMPVLYPMLPRQQRDPRGGAGSPARPRGDRGSRKAVATALISHNAELSRLVRSWSSDRQVAIQRRAGIDT